MALVLLGRNVILALAVIILSSIGMFNETTIIVVPLALILFCWILGLRVDLQHLLVWSVYRSMTRRLVSVGALGIVWSMATGLVLQYDKLIINIFRLTSLPTCLDTKFCRLDSSYIPW